MMEWKSPMMVNLGLEETKTPATIDDSDEGHSCSKPTTGCSSSSCDFVGLDS